jgi:CO/xanthine dehydrogenase FAD-binding subunit
MLSVETFETLAQTQAALAQGSRYLGGGTILMIQANYGHQGFDRILRTTDSSLREIRSDGRRLRIGSAVTLAEIAAHHDLEFLAPVARSIGGPAIRNMATIGGNLFAPYPYGDFTTALLALDAIVHWADGREEPIEAFLAGRKQSSGIVAAISIERPGADEFRYMKVSRVKPKGVSIMTLAAHLRRQSGRLNDVRVAFGTMGPTALRAKSAEAALNGVMLDEPGISRALEVATNNLTPKDDASASAWYRMEVAPVYLKRLLLQGGQI